MAVAQGSCPNCGAPIEFGIGASLAKVCDYCRHTVVRSDRGLEHLGKVADLAQTPALIAVGDQGTLAGRPLMVLGRAQLDQGQGPWDEYYVAFDHGQSWGWLAYAQGNWYVTSLASAPAPPYDALSLEMDVPLGPFGVFRVAELKHGTIVSAEGELPGLVRPGAIRYYADLHGTERRFATLDYGDHTRPCEVYVGYVFDEAQLAVSALGPRSVHKVRTQTLRCPSCGGDVPKLGGDRVQRLGCPYCGAVSDIALQRVVSVQEAARDRPDIPVSSRGTFDGVEYVCIAYLRRGSDFEGEHYTWEEYLLFAQSVGFRWLVKDPETGWSWVTPVNIAELDLRHMPRLVLWGRRQYHVRNQSEARVEYVIGEVYWRCEVGETTRVMDFALGRHVLSRELSGHEVHWSSSTPIPWPVIAQGFGLPVDGPGAVFAGAHGSAGDAAGGSRFWSVAGFAIFVIIAMIVAQCDDAAGAGGSGIHIGSSRSGGSSFGGK
jgi:hypothetical protein